ncbi:MAG: glycoside hydrolase family 3 protein [Clostridiales bacterium]|nr:glycoside hydrolase family 3 protein [Bacillota bacterium]MCI6604583.1 glycoside hydrolase family 3 protein [Clostridiales bacterium]
MKPKTIAILVIILCVCMVLAALALILWNMPKKQPGDVETLQTSSVFSSEPSAVEPDREQAYEGELPAAALAPEAPRTQETPSAAAQSTQLAEQILDTMTLEEKLWQLFFVAPEALTGEDAVTESSDALQQALAEKPVGGVILFARNLISREQTVSLLADVKSASRLAPFLGVDEEGGTVSRVGANSAMGVTQLQDMSAYGASGDASALYGDLYNLAQSLNTLGFNVDFAPVADVTTGSDENPMKLRSFSSDPERCASMVSVSVGALQDGGVAACLKHFPGYGTATADDHNGSVSLDRTLEQLEQTEFVPFSAGIDKGAYFVMVSHLSVPAVTGDDTPADLSEKLVTELLRNTLHFQNIVITDAQNMGSIAQNYTSAEAAVAALRAGVDMVLMPQDLQEAYDGVVKAIADGVLTEDRIDRSVLRILNVKIQLGLLSEVPQPAE